MFTVIWQKLIRFAFRLLYNELAWTYDVVSWLVSLGKWRDWQYATLPFVRGAKVLEVGYGPGHMLIAMSEAGYDCVGLDLSAKMSNLAQRRIQRNGLSIPLLRGKVQALPFAEKSFDTVLMTFPADFVMEVESLTAVSQALKDNGRFIILPAAQLTGTSPLHHAIEWLYHITGQRHEGGGEEVDVWLPFQQQLQKTKFQSKIHQIHLQNSQVTIIVCKKVCWSEVV